MVDFPDHGFRECAPDGGDGQVCLLCAFKVALTDFLETAAEARERQWDEVVGGLVYQMHNATAALHRLRRERFTDEHDEIANAREAAHCLATLLIDIEHLRCVVMGEDDDDDDQADD